MIRKALFIFCDNEHGVGDVTFPELASLTETHIIEGADRIAALRKEAKQQGWGRVNGGDYCPQCMESM